MKKRKSSRIVLLAALIFSAAAVAVTALEFSLNFVGSATDIVAVHANAASAKKDSGDYENAAEFDLDAANTKAESATGDEPFDARARIGFKDAEHFYLNSFYLEKNNGETSVRVYISQVQNVDTVFTLEEQRFQAEDTLFVFAESYVLRAGSAYVDAVFRQKNDAESADGVRLSDIYIRCDTNNVIAGDVEYFGESEFCDDDFLAVVYDKTGDSEMIIESFPYSANETDGSISARVVRSGNVSGDCAVYYRVNGYDAENDSELKIDNYNSVLAFEQNEREKAVVIEYFDNNHLNLSQSFEIEFYNVGGAEKVFDVSRRRYLSNDENVAQTLAIFDDESASPKYKASVQYYPSESREACAGQTSEGSVGEITLSVSALNGSTLAAFRIYYSVTSGGSAVYGKDFTLSGNYERDGNLGYIDVPAGGTAHNQFEGKVYVNTFDNAVMDGTKTVNVRFFVYNGDVRMQPLNTVRFDITDNDYPPYNDTVRWSGALNCPAYVDWESSVLTFAYDNFSQTNCAIGVSTTYSGVVPLTIPVMFTDITAKNGADYIRQEEYATLVYYPELSAYAVYIDLPSFDFSGVRRFKISIVESGLTQGLTLSGSADLYVDIAGRLEADYTYRLQRNPNKRYFRRGLQRNADLYAQAHGNICRYNVH
jgi:hypothetical protein